MITKQKFYFLHIPKTAGTSVNAWLKAQPGFRICPDGLWSLLLKREYESLDAYNFFAGHFYTYLDSYLQCNLSTFTFLRHPVERSLSHYRHIMREKAHYLHKDARRLKSFKGFILHPKTRPIIENFQTRALSMRFDISRLPRKKSLFNRSSYPLEQYIESTMKGYISTVHLPRAMQYLDNCCFVGITENMEGSLRRLKAVLGIDGEAFAAPFLNRATNKPSGFNLPQDEYKMLMGLIADDMALYEYAKSLLNSPHDNVLRTEF